MPLDEFGEDIAARCRQVRAGVIPDDWSTEQPDDWSTEQQVAVAVVLGAHEHLARLGYAPAEAVNALVDTLARAMAQPPADPQDWVAEIRGAVGLPVAWSAGGDGQPRLFLPFLAPTTLPEGFGPAQLDAVSRQAMAALVAGSTGWTVGDPVFWHEPAADRADGEHEGATAATVVNVHGDGRYDLALHTHPDLRFVRDVPVEQISLRLETPELVVETHEGYGPVAIWTCPVCASPVSAHSSNMEWARAMIARSMPPRGHLHADQSTAPTGGAR